MIKKLFLYPSIALCSSLFINAATVSWDNGGADVFWATAANWGGDALPLVADTAQNTSTNDITLQTTQSVAAYQSRNNELNIITGGNLTVAGLSQLTHGGSAAGSHGVNVSGTGSFTTNSANYSSAGANDTVARVNISDTASFTVTTDLTQSGTAGGTLVYTQSGGTVRIDGTLGMGSLAGATTAKDYQLNLSGGTLSYGIGNFGTEVIASADTLIALTGNTFTINASTDGGVTINGDTNLGVDGQTTFALNSSGIGTWNAGDLTIDAGHLFTIDLTGADQSDLYATFELMNYTSLTNAFDASQFSFTGNLSSA